MFALLSVAQIVSIAPVGRASRQAREPGADDTLTQRVEPVSQRHASVIGEAGCRNEERRQATQDDHDVLVDHWTTLSMNVIRPPTIAKNAVTTTRS